MFDNLKTSKAKRILALEAINTLQTTVGDDCFGQRIQINFDWIVKKLAAYIVELKLADFFDYIVEFVKMFHGNFTEDNLKLILDALVQRVLIEQKEIAGNSTAKKTLDLRAGTIKTKEPNKKKNKHCEFRIAKCWSVIRYIAEHHHFSGPLVPIIEQCTIPLLQFMANP